MKRFTAGQKIGAQMVSATDGSAFTAAVTVEVTIDAGTQTTGTVNQGAGAGVCVHEGNGYHTYAPSAAETNGDIVAFTFHATGAVPSTVQVFTNRFPALDPGTAGGLFIVGANAATSVVGGINTTSNIKQNAPLAGLEFLMTDSTNHNPAMGKTVAVTRSIDGAAFGATSSAPLEVSVGIYKIDLSAADLNGKTITFRATASGCDDTFFEIVTVP